MHTVHQPPDNPPQPRHRPQLPHACWAVIDWWKADHGVPAYPLPPP